MQAHARACKEKLGAAGMAGSARFPFLAPINLPMPSALTLLSRLQLRKMSKGSIFNTRLMVNQLEMAAMINTMTKANARFQNPIIAA